MAKLVIECAPDTEYLEQVVRTIGRHLTALADDLAMLRADAGRAGDDLGAHAAEPPYGDEGPLGPGVTPC